MRTEHWGDDTILKECRDRSLRWIAGSNEDLSALCEKLDSHIPDMDDFGSFLGSFALNAGCAHLDLIRQTQTDGSQPLIDALQMCYETVDFCVQQDLAPEPGPAPASSDIENHDMMNREVEWQIDQLGRIKGQQDLSRFIPASVGDPRVNAFITEMLTKNR
jgi:hypothetical protein